MFDPTTPTPERTPLLPDVTQYLDKSVDDMPADLCERMRIRLAIIGWPLEDWVRAPSTKRKRAVELADEKAELRARWNEQEAEREAERIARGRFKLCEIALMVEATGEDKSSFLQKLQDAARKKLLAMYRPGEEGSLDYVVKDDNGAELGTIPVRDFHEEARWDEVNAWLEKHERHVRVRFIALPGAATSQAASRPERGAVPTVKRRELTDDQRQREPNLTAAASITTETPAQRQIRRLARFRALGADLQRVNADRWRLTGTRGALATLSREEKCAGRARHDAKDVRRELVMAVEAEIQKPGVDSGDS
jgi:hypothetical protein